MKYYVAAVLRKIFKRPPKHQKRSVIIKKILQPLRPPKSRTTTEIKEMNSKANSEKNNRRKDDG